MACVILFCDAGRQQQQVCQLQFSHAPARVAGVLAVLVAASVAGEVMMLMMKEKRQDTGVHSEYQN